MHILFISNFYPPYSRGGYEQWCQETAEELVRRGHNLHVLTSRSPDGSEVTFNKGVYEHRLLNLEVDGGMLETTVRLLHDRCEVEEHNKKQAGRLITSMQPDIVVIWGMWNIHRSIAALVEQLLNGRVVYFLCDYWLTLPSAYIQRLQVPGRRKSMRWAKWLLKQLFLAGLQNEPLVILRLENPICISQAVQNILVQAGVPIDHAQIIHLGTQTEKFVAPAINKRTYKSGHLLKLLYAGRLDVEKGVHTAINAISLLVKKNKKHISLDIVGKGNPNYKQRLKLLVEELNLGQQVFFRRNVSRAEMPALYAKHDALIFPSEWPEPFSRVVLEAMAAGLVVIGTTTGGTSEILVEGKTGLTYETGDAASLARQIERLISHPELFLRLAEEGQRTVMQQFTFRSGVDRLEAILQQVVGNAINGVSSEITLSL